MGYEISSSFQDNLFTIKNVDGMIKKLKDHKACIDQYQSIRLWDNDVNFNDIDSIGEWVRWDFTLNSYKQICCCGKCPDKDLLVKEITGIQFNGEYQGDDYKIFELLAEFVEDESYIEITGEDGDKWRWVFNKGKVKEIKPKLVWSD